MSTLRQFASRIRNTFLRRRSDSHLEEELQSHFELLVEQNLRSGLPLAEARRLARLSLGGAEQIKESVQDHRGLPVIESLWQDVRYGARMLRKSPGFTAVAVLTLALGIGANTAIFSLVNAVLLKTLPVAHPHELILFSDAPGSGSNSGDQTGKWDRFSSVDYKYFSDHNHSFKDLCAYQTYDERVKIRVSGAKESRDFAVARMVSGNFFTFLGLHPPAGRLFSLQDDQPSATPVAVLSYAYWNAKFQADPALMGQAVQLNGNSFTIIGVAPKDFSGLGFRPPDIWLTLSAQPVVESARPYSEDPREYWLNIVGREKPGISMGQAQADVNILLKQDLNSQLRRERDEKIANSHVQLAPGSAGISILRSHYASALYLLTAVVGIVLLLACANVANLLLSRSAARRGEISIRLAVGASKGRLIRQFLTESILLAGIGGVLALLVGRWTAESLVSLVLGSSLSLQASLNAPVLLFTAVVSILSGVLFGLLPALGAGRMDLARATVRPSLRPSLAGSIVVFQIAASVVFLFSAGLFLRTLRNLAAQDLGFDTDHLLTAHVDPEAAGYTPSQTPGLYQALIDRMEAIPGVRSATVTTDNPLNGNSWSSNFAIEGLPESQTGKDIVLKHLVGPHYFATEGIPILLGRDIEPKDRAGSPLVTVINESMARKFFPGENPIGHRFSLGSPFKSAIAMTIVGVAADARYYSLRDLVPPMEFCAAFQVPDSSTHNAGFAGDIEVRTIGNPSGIANDIRAAVSQVSANLRVDDLTIEKEEVSLALRPNRSAAELAGAFGILALLLACIGLYGMMAHRVSRRTHEIGVRLALGAQPNCVLWMITRECLLLIGAGVLFGVPVALASSRIIASQLFDVGSTDPLTLVSVAIVLLFISLAACWVPARRATKVDPVVALRHE
jgi:predicted permease